MARIDLIDVGKTLRGGRSPEAAAMPTAWDLRGHASPAFSMQRLNLQVPDGKTMVVLGPSGCGKSTLLRLIGGLIEPDAGEVRYDGVDVGRVPPGERQIGMVFQNYALYPHVSARSNVLSYFWFRKKTPELDALALARYQRTSELMGVELAGLLDRRPATLSGGEQQRVAVARCITRDARLFLVDEPFANLDQALREKYRLNLKLLLQQFAITTVYVTHDHHEALILADLVAVMDRGRIEQVGTPEEIYERPKNAFVAGFLSLNPGAPPISLIDATGLPQAQGRSDLLLGVRPEHVEVSGEPHGAAIEGIVTSALSFPPHQTTLLTVRLGEQELRAQGPGLDRHRAGDRVWLGFRQHHLFDKASGARR